VKETYRVAVPTNDGVTVSPHLGRSNAFIVAEIRGGAVVGTRSVPVAAGRGMQHRHGACDGGGGGFGGAHRGQGAGRARGHGDHQGILAALDGVDVVLVGGAGRRILEDLMAGGIALEAARGDSIEDALAQFAASRA
jgi:predicted Fe-Mo cluster-binding NifX family protein